MSLRDLGLGLGGGLEGSHRLAASGALWLGTNDKTFAYFGLNDALRERAKRPVSTAFICT